MSAVRRIERESESELAKEEEKTLLVEWVEGVEEEEEEEEEE